MINLYTVRNQKKDPNKQDSNLTKSTPAQLRASKDLKDILSDLSESKLTNSVLISQSKPDDVMNYKITIKPEEGYYRGGKFLFDLKIPVSYPHEPPKLKCETSVYHPNIDQEGNVCLNILREDWKPVLSISTIVYGLIHIFNEPNPEDPLNKEAGELLRNDKRQFEYNVKRNLSRYH